MRFEKEKKIPKCGLILRGSLQGLRRDPDGIWLRIKVDFLVETGDQYLSGEYSIQPHSIIANIKAPEVSRN